MIDYTSFVLMLLAVVIGLPLGLLAAGYLYGVALDVRDSVFGKPEESDTE